MILNNKVYDALKWAALILLPAIAVLYSALANIWGLPYSAQVTGTIVAINLFLGAILQISNFQFRSYTAANTVVPQPYFPSDSQIRMEDNVYGQYYQPEKVEELEKDEEPVRKG